MTKFLDDVVSVDWTRLETIVFDVDGTLYDQTMLRRKMLLELLVECSRNPGRLSEIRVLSVFRKLRESRFGSFPSAGEHSLESDQYRWTAEKLACSPDRVRGIVSEWMRRRPLRHLLSCRPAGVRELFQRLFDHGIKVAIFSDYPAQEKLGALELRCDLCVSAEDAAVNRLKPDPAGLHYILSRFSTVPERALFIGDRMDRDGACAARAGCSSLILSARYGRKQGPTQSYDLIFPPQSASPETKTPPRAAEAIS